MNRRKLIQNLSGAAMAAAAVTVAPKLAFADESHDLNSSSIISANHGHEVNISIDELVIGLRAGGLAEVDIQGASGHPHSISLSTGEILKVLFDGEVEVTSSRDAGHSHGVTIRLA